MHTFRIVSSANSSLVEAVARFRASQRAGGVDLLLARAARDTCACHLPQDQADVEFDIDVGISYPRSAR